MTIAPGQRYWDRTALVLRRPVSPVTRVVVGVDGSAGSAAALLWAAEEALRCQTVLRIISVWQEPGQPRGVKADHPAQTAARFVEKALARVLSQQHYPRRIACAALRGTPAQALLSQAHDTGLLVLGAAEGRADRLPGPVGEYCLLHGRGPLVLVPGEPERLTSGRSAGPC